MLFAGTIIAACAILHNLMIRENYPLPPENEIVDQMNQPDDFANDDGCVALPTARVKHAGDLERANMIRQHF